MAEAAARDSRSTRDRLTFRIARQGRAFAAVGRDFGRKRSSTTRASLPGGSAWSDFKNSISESCSYFVGARTPAQTHRSNRGPLRAIFVDVIEDDSDCAFTQFRGVLAGSCHGFHLSRNEPSDNPGTVHRRVGGAVWCEHCRNLHSCTPCGPSRSAPGVAPRIVPPDRVQTSIRRIGSARWFRRPHRGRSLMK